MNKILSHSQIQQKINRISHEIIENFNEEKKIFIAGIAGNGTKIAQELAKVVLANCALEIEVFEIKLYKENPLSGQILCDFDLTKLENTTVILVDDVVNSGKTMQYALTKILEVDTKNIKTVALVNRTHRRFPIKCDFVGLTLSTTLKDRVEIELGKEENYAYLI